MNKTIKELKGLLPDVFSCGALPKKIKITRHVADVLNEESKPVFREMYRDEFVKTYGGTGTVGQFTGIPIEVDDTIEGNYELVY